MWRSSDPGPRARSSIGLVFVGIVASSCIDASRQATCPVPAGQAAPKSCAAGTRPSEDGLVDDFEDGNNQVAKVGDRTGDWFTSHDPNGSTIDPSPFTMSEGGAGGSKKALHVFGQTSGDTGAWGILVGATFVSEGIYDASKYAGISFKAKAGKNSTKTVRFKVADVNTHPDGGVCKNCWNHFGKDLPLSDDWQEYKISFAEMKQEAGWGEPFPAITPAKLIAINWSVGPGRSYDLWIDDIQFFECM
jgi:hypothetical protein